MSRLRIERVTQLTAGQRAQWSAALRGTNFGELTIPWTETVRRCGPANLEVYYLQVFAGETPRALAVLHILRTLDLSEYMGSLLKKVFAPLGWLGWRPLAVDLAFIEVPMANVSGIRLVPGAEPDAAAIAALVLDHVRSSFEYSVLCLKASPDEPGEGAFGTLGLLTTGFLANMRVEFSGEATFNDYLKRLTPKARTQCRAFAREFAAAGGAIDIIEAPDDQLIETMDRLYTQTLAHHMAHSNLQLPIPVTAAFFPSLLNALPGAARVFVVRVHAETIGFALVVDDGDTSYFTHAGLDYARTVPTRAYFNIYYAIFADAIGRGRRSLKLGAEAYTVKRKMGASASPTVYHFEVANPVLGTIASLVARNFAAQEGSQMASRHRAGESAGDVA